MFFLPSLIIGLASLTLIHRWAVGALPALARQRRRFAGALAALLAGQVMTGLAARRWPLHALELMQTATTVAVMTLEIAALPIGAVVIASWLARSWGRRADTLPVPAASEGMSRRQVVEGVAGLGAIGASGAVLGWGSLYGRHEFETREVPVRIPGLPRALDGYVVVQISDLHVGIHMDGGDLDAGLELVRRARPDLLVVTGDLVDHDARLAPLVGRKLANLPARDGVVAILGNHDHYAGADAVVAGLRAAGVKALVDDGLVVRPGDGGGFALLGVDDRWAQRHGKGGPDLDRAIAAVPRDLPRVLLSHQPVTVDSWAGRVALQLSGHTHGGQINPGFRPADLFFDYVAGLYSVRGTTLYVNRGFGTVGPPARVGAPPEVTRLILVAA